MGKIFLHIFTNCCLFHLFLNVNQNRNYSSYTLKKQKVKIKIKRNNEIKNKKRIEEIIQTMIDNYLMKLNFVFEWIN